MDLHGTGLERIVERIRSVDERGETILDELIRDELVSSLLVLHGLHPHDVEARVTEALHKVRPRLQPHGYEVELLGIQNGRVRLRLRANGHGCGSTARTLKEMVENAIYQGAPDITSLTIEEAAEKQGFVPLEMLQRSGLVVPVSNTHALEEGAL
jgi:Fe-S cluster biogenesis protein NfuA